MVPLSARTLVLFQRYNPTGVASVPTAANWLIADAATARSAVRSGTENQPTVPVMLTVSEPTQGSQHSDIAWGSVAAISSYRSSIRNSQGKEKTRSRESRAGLNQ